MVLWVLLSEWCVEDSFKNKQDFVNKRRLPGRRRSRLNEVDRGDEDKADNPIVPTHEQCMNKKTFNGFVVFNRPVRAT